MLYLRIYYKEDKMNLAKFFSDAIYIVFEPNEIKTKKIKQFLDYIHGDINDEDIQGNILLAASILQSFLHSNA